MSEEKIKTLNALVSNLTEFFPEGFEKDLFNAACQNLENTKNPLRVNNFSANIRELLRHSLTRLGADDEIKQCEWWLDARFRTPKQREEPIESHKIYRSEKMKYAIQGGLSDKYVTEELLIDNSAEVKNLTAIYEDLNKYTHIELETFALSGEKQSDLIIEILEVMTSFFKTIKECRKALLDKLEPKLFDAVVAHEMAETIGALDSISGHYYVDEAYIENHKILEIDSFFIKTEVTGTLSVQLQFGSNSDVRNGEGALSEQDFPFTTNINFYCTDPTDYNVEADNFFVDTSSWTNNLYDDEDQES